MWMATPYQFEAMPNGYCDAMRIFAKLLKPVFHTLRKMGYVSLIYVDILSYMGTLMRNA